MARRFFEAWRPRETQFRVHVPTQQSQKSASTVAPVRRSTVAPVQHNSRRRNQQDADLANNFARNGTRERSKGTGEENGGRKSPKPPDQVGKKKEAGGGRKTSANSTPSASGQTEDRGDRRGAADDGGAAFERFWSVYPKRVAKEAARKAFARAAGNGTDVEALIAGAQRYAVERQDQDPKYTKHPATWLNGGCWEDEAPGAPVIDEHGNVVAFEQPQQQQEEDDVYARYQQMADIAYGGKSW